MAVWEEEELASPHNQGACWPLVGDSEAQGDGRNPKMNRQDVGGLRGKEKWRPDKIGTPEAEDIRRGRQEGPSGKSRRGEEGDCPAHLGTGSLLSPRPVPCPPSLPPPHSRIGPGGIGGRLGRSGEAGGRGLPRPEEQERRGAYFSQPIRAQEACWAPGEVPCPLRPGVRGTTGALLFLEPKPNPPQPPGPFPALWVVSIGPTHCPKLALA